MSSNPNNDNAYDTRGIAYSQKGQYDQAISDFNKAIEINPKNDRAYVGRAIAYTVTKKYDKAWEDVHRAQDLGYPIPRKLSDALRRASGRKK